MRIATWNVNSVRARLPNIVAWLTQHKPDVLLMQEIKCERDAFPAMEFGACGYRVQILGQKSYNGVAIASLHPLEDVREGLGSEDPQARYLEASIQGVRLASLYLPNGNPLGTEKYTYKLDWMARLKRRAVQLLRQETPVVLGGDFNVIPEPLDVYDPQGWEADALYAPETRAAYRQILHQGYTDIFRALHPGKRAYSFWDYQAGAWPRNQGLRIDHFLLSPEAVDKTVACQIDSAPRGEEKASDHTPVLLLLRD